MCSHAEKTSRGLLAAHVGNQWVRVTVTSRRKDSAWNSLVILTAQNEAPFHDLVEALVLRLGGCEAS